MPSTAVQEAMWRGDVDELHRLAPCKCCCDEHTYKDCSARQWYGCKGQNTDPDEDSEWAKFYEQTRGMPITEFFPT